MADGLPIPGVDYAFPPRPDITALAAAGFKFACRYGGPGTEGKWVHADEAAQLAAAGVWIVANAEGSADGLGNGSNTGVSWAKSAETWFASLAMPPDRPIYLSADFDVTVDDWPAVADALRGAASVIGAARVGVYGGYNVMRWAARDGVAKWFWQTYAWSAGRWAPGNHIEQYRNGVQIAGADCDLNRAMQADYGQWMPGRLPTKGLKMYVLVKKTDDDKVYLADGMTCRWIQTPQDLADIKYLASTGQIAPLYKGGEIQVVGNLGVYGLELGKDDGGSASGSLDETTTRRIVREELDKTHLTAAAPATLQG
jgi:hypothetical protein